MSFLGSCFAFYQPTFHWRCTFWLRKSAIVTWRARRPVADPQSWKIGVTLDTDDAHLQFHHVETGLPQRRTLRGLPRSDLDQWLQSVINHGTLQYYTGFHASTLPHVSQSVRSCMTTSLHYSRTFTDCRCLLSAYSMLVYWHVSVM